MTMSTLDEYNGNEDHDRRVDEYRRAKQVAGDALMARQQAALPKPAVVDSDLIGVTQQVILTHPNMTDATARSTAERILAVQQMAQAQADLTNAINASQAAKDAAHAERVARNAAGEAAARVYGKAHQQTGLLLDTHMVQTDGSDRK